MSKILVTGASGFVGSRLCEVVAHDGWSVRRAVRHLSGAQDEVVAELRDDADWSEALKNINVVIHLAARVHVMNDDAIDPLTEFRAVNTSGTLCLAKQAVESGIKRFIYLSSIKVNGEFTQSGLAFNPDDGFIPTDPYGLSKYEAEQGLLELAEQTDMEVVIIRPPLVYGPGVKANFASMIKWVNRGVPFPFGAVYNKRSLIALDNLVSFIVHCIDHPKAANEVFLVSDGEDVSMSELLRKVAKVFGKKLRLIPVPVCLMIFLAKLIGKGDVASRLFGSLQVDS
ncbi:MAG: SDR family oxidoreductase, partial [Candidatus Thioglobus sp.]